MAMAISEKETEFLSILKKITRYEEAVSLLFWDARTGAPKKGASDRAETIGELSAVIFEMQTSEKIKDLIESLSNESDHIHNDTRHAVEEAKKVYDLFSKIPAEEYQAFVVLQSQAETVWEEAKEKADFSLFAPYLEKLIDYKKRFIGYWGYSGNKYNTLLDQYEPGLTVEKLDEMFGKLKEAIVPLVKKVGQSSSQPDTSFASVFFPKEDQKKLSLFFLKELGYDFNAGRLDETVHPFQITINPGDARVTTKYDEYDFRSALFGTIHECGHAMYEQNIDEALSGTNLRQGTSMGIHESQSLFFENFIGRNQSFWNRYFTDVKSHAPEAFKTVDEDQFYRAVNESKPSLIRVEADELTYPLHIMVRYEIEKAIFNDEVTVDQLPDLWNSKYKAYLGISPSNDAEGILQDVHWSGGDFGYFPSYALGYMYAAQFKSKLAEDIPEFEQLIEKGEFQQIIQWLKENVHVHGKRKKPLEIIREVTNEELNVQYLIDYLTDKYETIYLKP